MKARAHEPGASFAGRAGQVSQAGWLSKRICVVRNIEVNFSRVKLERDNCVAGF